MPAYRASRGRLLTTSQTIHRAEREVVVVSMILCNTDTSNRTFQIQHVPADGDASDDHALFHDTPIFMETGDSITALASVADKVAMQLYYLDYDQYLRAFR